MERGQRQAAERVRARPARWPGRRRRPTGNARPAAAAAVVRGRGAGAASMAGAAGCPVASGLRAAAGSLCPLCCRFPPRGAAIAGAPHRGGTRCRFTWALRGAPRGLRRRPHLPKGHPPTSRRSGRSPARRAGAARAAGVACECGNGDPLLSVEQPLLTPPTASAGGCRGGVPFSRVHGQE